MTPDAPRPTFTCSKCGGSDLAISHKGDPFCKVCAPCPCAKCMSQLEARAVTPETVIALIWEVHGLTAPDVEPLLVRAGYSRVAAIRTARRAHGDPLNFLVGPVDRAIKHELVRLVMERAGIGEK